MRHRIAHQLSRNRVARRQDHLGELSKRQQLVQQWTVEQRETRWSQAPAHRRRAGVTSAVAFALNVH
jgi:hypothetical protein